MYVNGTEVASGHVPLAMSASQPIQGRSRSTSTRHKQRWQGEEAQQRLLRSEAYRDCKSIALAVTYKADC
jgi:hypothetical protein